MINKLRYSCLLDIVITYYIIIFVRCRYLPVASLVVFMMGFSLGFGGLPFLLLGELFPQHYRSQLSAMASAVNLLSMFTVIKSFHALEVSCMLGIIFFNYTFLKL